MITVENILNINNVLGESPLWHPGEDVLYWVDINGKQFFRLDVATGEYQTFDADHEIGCLALHAGGGLLIAKTDGIFSWMGDALTPVLSAEEMAAPNRFNDGKVDRAGRFWIGTSSNKPVNKLYCIERDGAFRVAEAGVMVSNGIGWSPDNRTMYYSDSGGSGIVYAYDYDLDSGAISNRRTWLPSTGTPARADGLTVDSEGCVWIAFWDGWRVERRAPDGELLDTVEMPVQRPTSVNFGGPDMRDLYVTSAGLGCDDQPQAGDVFRLRTDSVGEMEPVCVMPLKRS